MQLNLDKTNFNNVRTSNISLVMKHVLMSDAPISRADISKKTGLTRATISSLVADLIDLKFLEEVGESSTKSVGKKAVLLRVRIDTVFTISVEFYSSKIYVAKENLLGMPESKHYAKVSPDATEEEICSKLFSMIDDLMAEMSAVGQICYGIGLAAPSPIKGNAMQYSIHFAALCGIDLITRLQARYSCRISVLNNADAAALAESRYGKHVNCDCLVYLWVEQGVGCGVVKNSELVVGRNHVSTEFGHSTVKLDSEVTCFCGKKGCLCSYGSDRALARLLRESSLTQDLVAGSRDVPMINYIELEHQYTHSFREVQGTLAAYLDEVAHYFGASTANLINIIVPDIIVVQGELFHLPRFFDTFKRYCEHYTHPIYNGSCIITDSSVGKDAVLIGASVQLLDELYSNPYCISGFYTSERALLLEMAAITSEV